MNGESESGKQLQSSAASVRSTTGSAASTPARFDSRELFAQAREVEINHGGRIYRLRITQQNKLILTA